MICPILRGGFIASDSCMEELCAWWIWIDRIDKYGTCAIKVIGTQLDNRKE